jgi:hypothetical protein
MPCALRSSQCAPIGDSRALEQAPAFAVAFPPARALHPLIQLH